MPKPPLLISSLADVAVLRQRITGAAARAHSALTRLLSELSALQLLTTLRFSEAGFHPLEDRPLNLIEQLNQSLTCLVSLAAAEYLLRSHPDAAPYRLNFGAHSGTDITGSGQAVVAEVFAAVRPDNNKKLAKDVRRIAAVQATHRYVFFHCPGIPPGDRPGAAAYPTVRIVSLSEAALFAPGAGA